ncbi:hypothetical protein PG984_013854 [Apiospora sp. TS-2023a]
MAPSSSFTFETPSPSNARGTRTRPRNLDPVAASPGDAESKGGRSLRKRTRIDYSFDRMDDVVQESTASKATPSTTRSLKKRKTDFALPGEVFDDEPEPRAKRRASEQPAKSASKRAQPRKSTLDPQPFVAEQLEEDVPVQDTIEVGGHHSEVSDESFHQRTNSGSSHTGSAGPLAHMAQDEEDAQHNKSEDAPVSNAIDTAVLPESTVETKMEVAPDTTMQTAVSHPPKVEVEEPPDVQMPEPVTSEAMSVQKPEAEPQMILEVKPTEKPAEAPADAPTDAPMEKPEEVHDEIIETAEEKPEEKPKEQHEESSVGILEEKPTVSSAEEPVEQLTEAVPETVPEMPTEEPTEEPAEEPTEEPTEESTEEPAEKLTGEPTGKLVEEPIEKPTEDIEKPTEESTAQPPEATVEETIEEHVEEHPEKLEQQYVVHSEDKAEVKPKETLEEQPEEAVKGAPQENPVQKTEEQPEETSLDKPQENQIKKELKTLLVKEQPPARSTVEKEVNNGPYAYLTPYIEGSKVMYPAITEEEMAEAEVIQEAPEEEAVDEVGNEDTPAGTPAATANNSPVPEAEVLSIQPPAKKQYQFKQPRPASELTSLFDDVDSLNEADLYERLAAVNNVLVAWQEEWVRLRKIVDDEDNAVKYQAEEAAFLQREKMALCKDPDAVPVRKDFQVKGIRAPKEDSMVLYARQQDRVMASAYLFEYDDRDSKIGMQDPLGQRRGVGKARLRDRPKQTAKAAEIDDVNPNVVHGKRTRKPTNLFGDVEATSRSSTPVPTQPPPKRRRGRQNGEENGDSNLSFSSQPEPPVEETPKKRGRGGRAKKPNAPTSVPEDPSTENEAQPDPDEFEERPSRKRRRKAFHDEEYTANDNHDHEVITNRSARARRHSRLTEVPTGSFYSTTSIPSTQGPDESRPNTSSSTATASTTVSAYGLREKRQKKFSLDEDDGDFEDNEDQRKPKRNRRVSKKAQANDFADAAHDRPEPAPEPTPEPAVVAPKMTKIKIKNFNGNTGSFTSAVPPPTSHPTSMPVSNGPGPVQLNNAHGPPNGNGAPAHGSEAPKDYGSMTKSEKMSASMKGMISVFISLHSWVSILTSDIARWASGSMSPAVAKRRATLAAKKAAAKTPIPEFHPGAVFQQHRATHPHPHPQ